MYGDAESWYTSSNIKVGDGLHGGGFLCVRLLHIAVQRSPPAIPQRSSSRFVSHHRRESQNSPRILEGRHETKTDPDDAQFPTDLFFERLETDAGSEHLHLFLGSQQCRRSARITHATGAQRYALLTGGIFNEIIRDRIP